MKAAIRESANKGRRCVISFSFPFIIFFSPAILGAKWFFKLAQKRGQHQRESEKVAPNMLGIKKGHSELCTRGAHTKQRVCVCAFRVEGLRGGAVGCGVKISSKNKTRQGLTPHSATVRQLIWHYKLANNCGQGRGFGPSKPLAHSFYFFLSVLPCSHLLQFAHTHRYIWKQGRRMCADYVMPGSY